MTSAQDITIEPGEIVAGAAGMADPANSARPPAAGQVDVAIIRL
jgi:hypothetical protein